MHQRGHVRGIENVMFNLMVVIILLESAIRCGSSLTSSSTGAMSAASTAMSLPTPPIAMPTRAALRKIGFRLGQDCLRKDDAILPEHPAVSGGDLPAVHLRADAADCTSRIKRWMELSSPT